MVDLKCRPVAPQIQNYRVFDGLYSSGRVEAHTLCYRFECSIENHIRGANGVWEHQQD